MRITRAAAVLAMSISAWGAASLSASASETTVSHGISAFGALKYPADFTHYDYAIPDAPKGGSIALRPVVASRTFDSFNLYILKGDPADGTDLIFDTLMTRAYDEPDAVYGLLAESVEMPADRSWALFTLRPEARFSSGAPVTAEDVVWSIETLKTDGNPRIRLPLRDVATIEALDERRVRVVFADGAAMRDQASRVALMPIFEKAHFADKDFAEPSLVAPVGSGPYLIEDYTPGKTVTYARRDDYWAKDLPVRKGQFNFDVISYEYFLDSDVGLEAFKAGAVDFNEEYSSKNWATAYRFPAVEKGWVIKETIGDGRPSGTQGFWINTRREKFADPRVRKALDLAFDFEWSNRSLFYGQYKRTDSFFENSEDLQAFGPPTAGELALLEPYRDALPAAVFEAEAYVPPETPGDGKNRRNLRQAKRLLAEAGWTVQDGVLKNAEGEVFEIEFLDRVQSAFDRIIKPFIANLEILGFQATLRQVDPAQYEQRAEEFDYDIVTARNVLSSTPGPELRGYLTSISADQPKSFNLAGVKSEAIDALIEKINAAQSREELQDAARALDRVFRASHFWVPQWHSATHRIAYWDKFGRPEDRGVEKPPYWRGIRHLWWYDAEKAAALDAQRGG